MLPIKCADGTSYTILRDSIIFLQIYYRSKKHPLDDNDIKNDGVPLMAACDVTVVVM